MDLRALPNSMGKRMTVLEGLLARPSIVCNVLNSKAMGFSAISFAALARFSAARRSPSALVIVARFSLCGGLPGHYLLQFFWQVKVL